MAKKKNTSLADTGVIQSRQAKAEALEREKLDVKAELEKYMREYAKISGIKELGNRQYKVGKAPNDYKFEN